MSAANSPFDLQRAQGAATVAFKRRGAATVLDRLHQQGCAKIRLPKVHDLTCPEAVTLNTAGGLTGGDRLTIDCHWASQTQATVTTQAAERVYKSAFGSAKVTNRLTIAAGAKAHWLPQETILFDGGAIRRLFDVDLAIDAQLIAMESWMIGRHAMGEVVRSGEIHDRWHIRQADKLIFADALKLDGDIQALLERPAVAQSQRCFATLLIVLPKLAALQESLREAGFPCSIMDRLLIARLVSEDIASLRQQLIQIMRLLDVRVPWVWNC